MPALESFLVDCLRFALDSHRFEKPSLPEGVEWEVLLRAASRHKALGALLFVEKASPGFFPSSIRQELSAYRYSFLVHADTAVQQVRRVLAGLSCAGIAAVVMKGWEYIHTVYGGDYSLRPCGDIDLLINPQALRPAEQVLKDAGYQPLVELWPGFRYRHHNRAYHYQLEQKPAPGFDFGVDLHWGLFNLRYYDRLIQPEEFIRRALPLQIGETAALRLCAEDHILHACGHLGLHHVESNALHRFYELAWVIAHAQPPVNWPLLLERAAAWRLQIPLRAVLLKMEELFPATLPQETKTALDSLQPGAEERRVYRLLMRYKDTPFVRILPFRWEPASVWQSLCFLFEAFVPGPQFLVHRYGQTRFWPLLYVKRAGNSIRQLLAFSKNSPKDL